MILWGLPVSTYTAKVRIGLLAKGLRFEERAPPGGYRSDAWRARVPTGTIPALELDDGVLIAESEVILEYVEEVFPQPSLLPGPPLQRAQARFLARLHDLHLEPRVRALFPLVRDASRTPQRVADALSALQAPLDRLALRARPAPWLAGQTLSVADCGHVVAVRLGLRLADALGGSLHLPDELRPWLDAADAHPAVIAGLAPWREATEVWLSHSLVPVASP